MSFTIDLTRVRSSDVVLEGGFIVSTNTPFKSKNEKEEGRAESFCSPMELAALPDNLSVFFSTFHVFCRRL